jgi:hypothetical protein
MRSTSPPPDTAIMVGTQTSNGCDVDKGKRWPGRPKLLPDESFSSWFARSAEANGLRPVELHHVVQPGGDRSPRDLDRHADLHLVQRAAEATGQQAIELEWSTFRRWAGTVFENDDGLTKLSWLPPAGRQGGTRCFGQQFCPLCLREDRVPYLRLTWRLAFVTVCPVHRILLMDRCPSCNEPVHVLRMGGMRNMACASCGADLRRGCSDAPPVDAGAVQEDLMRLLERGWLPMGTYGPQYSFAVLEVFALLTRLLAGGRHAYALRAWVNGEAPSLAIPPETLPRAREGALVTPRGRSVLVSMGHWLMSDWPERFVAAARATGMTGRDLSKRSNEHYPFAYADAVQWHLTWPTKRGNRDEVQAAKGALQAQGRQATRRELVGLFGSKRRTISELAEPSAKGSAWGQGRYWKLDGVSPEVKAAARVAAHQAGESVGPWLDRLLRRELSIPAIKMPSDRLTPDIFADDGISGCAE